MRKRTRALAMALAVSPAARPESTSAIEASIPSGHPKGLHLTAAAMVAPDGSWKPSGFLLGWAVEGAMRDSDADIGMSYLHLNGFGAPVTVVSLADVTLAQQGTTALFFGSGIGAVVAQGNARFGGRLFVGVEFFHRSVLPVALAVDLIMKFCDEESHLCPEKEQQTWIAGRMGFKF